MIEYVNNENNQETWKSYQNTLSCCGFKENAKTGDSCSNETPVDCRTQLYAVLGDYILFTAIALVVLTIVALILACSATYTFKDDCRKLSVCSHLYMFLSLSVKYKYATLSSKSLLLYSNIMIR